MTTTTVPTTTAAGPATAAQAGRAGVSWGAVAALMLMHVVVTVASVATFSRLLPVSRRAA